MLYKNGRVSPGFALEAYTTSGGALRSEGTFVRCYYTWKSPVTEILYTGRNSIDQAGRR